MSKIKLLLDVVSDMRSLADSIQVVCDAMEENQPVEIKSSNTENVESTANVSKPAITIEDVRAVLKTLKTETAKALITKFGCAKLTEVNPSDYAALITEAEVLADAK